MDDVAAPDRSPDAEIREQVRAHLRRMRLLGVRHLPVDPPRSPAEIFRAMEEEVRCCLRCPIGHSRRNAVFGSGDPEADLVFVGEAPGVEEDRSGLPFVGPAGDLLTKIIEAIGLRRDEVYIANILKCRPPENRDPAPEEIRSCSDYLWRQIDVIRPRVICALGGFAARTLIGIDTGISRLRGSFRDVRGYRVMPTYHPAYLLRNPSAKRSVWEDMKKVRGLLASTAPAAPGSPGLRGQDRPPGPDPSPP